jgi:hypothetical protein
MLFYVAVHTYLSTDIRIIHAQQLHTTELLNLQGLSLLIASNSQLANSLTIPLSQNPLHIYSISLGLSMLQSCYKVDKMSPKLLTNFCFCHSSAYLSCDPLLCDSQNLPKMDLLQQAPNTHMWLVLSHFRHASMFPKNFEMCL